MVSMKTKTYIPEWIVLEENSPSEMHYIRMVGSDAREYAGTESIWVIILDHIQEDEFCASIVPVNDSLVGGIVPLESTGPVSEEGARRHMDYMMRYARKGIVSIGGGAL
ncbi:hypothetical protein SHANETTE_21 [Bacillus phage Shanette]|uniref:Uncharacterized protein n=1 Tax=Bacillus phage Shanette TaxID=1296656 RepID=S5M9C3_9CAUD|nr:hypothetical protein AVV46_gp021 [Bacillus phage Shanette]AGR47128.1 hypothetical protein SHANETTE_21 [Bacillus phage Shanette]